MKCIYCEDSETQGVLLCYGCQVDLFPLVSSWAYCGACGNELPPDSTTCPQCAPAETMPSPMEESALASPAAADTASPSKLQRRVLLSSTKGKAPLLKPWPKEPPVTRTEIKQARQTQWVIRFIFALFWLLIMGLVLWWVRDMANQPSDTIFP